jgi:hypothetical protein
MILRLVELPDVVQCYTALAFSFPESGVWEKFDTVGESEKEK